MKTLKISILILVALSVLLTLTSPTAAQEDPCYPVVLNVRSTAAPMGAILVAFNAGDDYAVLRGGDKSVVEPDGVVESPTATFDSLARYFPPVPYAGFILDVDGQHVLASRTVPGHFTVVFLDCGLFTGGDQGSTAPTLYDS